MEFSLPTMKVQVILHKNHIYYTLDIPVSKKRFVLSLWPLDSIEELLHPLLDFTVLQCETDDNN